MPRVNPNLFVWARESPVFPATRLLPSSSLDRLEAFHPPSDLPPGSKERENAEADGL
jgi:hypothetical protein